MAKDKVTPKKRIAIDPVTVVVKECILLSSSMRKSSKYSQSGVAAILSGGASELFEDHDLKQFSSSNGHSGGASTGAGSSAVAGGSTHGISDPLLSGFIQLRLMLNNLSTLDDVDSLTLLQPFLLVIKSSSTTGAITSLALDSLSKFISYGIISAQSKNLNFTLTHIINSLTHCRFEASEQSSDDAVLLKVLKLLEILIDSDLGATLSDEVIHEVAQTSMSLACNKRRSEVLRKAAELSMYRITVKIFERLDTIEPEEEHQHIVDDTHDYSRDGLEEHALGTNEEMESSEKKSLDVNNVDRPFGLFAIKQFLGILISMISPENQFKHTESTKVFALSLITAAIELTADRFNSFPSLLNLVSDPVFKHTLQIIQTVNSLPVLQAAMQLFTSLSLTVGSRLQPQVELTLITIFDSILPEPSKDKSKSKSGKSTPVDSNVMKSQAAKELIIEELSILWTRSPDLFVNLFINYDCNFNRRDLSVKFIEFLAQLALPESALFSSDSVPPICLEGLLSFINDLSEQIKGISDFDNLATHKLLQDKEKKREFINATNIFNSKPKDGLATLAEKGFIADVSDKEVSKFIFSSSSRLNKKVLGEFIAKPANESLLKEFLTLFDFKGLRVDEALRILLKTFRLPGESQQIERIVETFAAHYVASQDPVSAEDETKDGAATEEKATPLEEGELEPVRPDSDAVFVLSYSIIMLNTDLHNPNIKAHMTIDDYKRNLRGVYGGKDFPAWYLEKIFQSINDKEIVMPEEHHGSSQWFDDSWNNLISANVSIPFEEHSVADFSRADILKFKKYIYANSFGVIADTVFKIFEVASDDQIITRMISTVDKLSQISSFFNLNGLSDDIVNRLCINTTLTGEKTSVMAGSTPSSTGYPIKFTKIKVEGGETINVTDIGIVFGKDFKAQLSTVVLFRIIQRNIKSLTTSWGNIIKVLLALLRYGLIDGSLLKSFQENAHLSELPQVKPELVLNRSAATKGIFSTFASYLKGEDEPSDEDVEFILAALDCIKSANVVSLFDGIDQLVDCDNRSFIQAALESVPVEKTDENQKFFDAQVFFLLELVLDMILAVEDHEESVPAVLDLVNDLLSKRKALKIRKELVLRLLTYRLMLLDTKQVTLQNKGELSASTFDELSSCGKEIFESQARQFLQPTAKILQSSSEIQAALLNHENFWKVLRSMSTFSEYTDEILRTVETLFKSEEITPSPLTYLNKTNFMWLLGLLDEISAVGAIGGQWEQEYDSLVRSGHKDIKKENPYQEIVQVSLKSIKFTSSLLPLRSQINEIQTEDEIFALIQALAHQCLNPCFQIRSYALSVLESTIFDVDTSKFAIRGIFEIGLFPLLKESSVDRVVILKLISKIYLHYMENGVNDEKIFLTILDIFNQFLEETDVEAALQEFIQSKRALEKGSAAPVEESEPDKSDEQPTAVIATATAEETKLESTQQDDKVEDNNTTTEHSQEQSEDLL
ncbi:hypothetical protein WICPIJ_007047 [Wickerhamomyces pijperi]|uniref:SEC7 domain-containing protein n=1 Tax=Wickerhamomyces pijperi TaxID=599730 RepID=A0A9P8TKA9_WICPI|nr:hypothetical protein WICPIJ_007047 [Wickerhamomyces pijperi]